MITPVVQRQMFQTINAEAVRAASEVSGLLQRETIQRQSMLDRLAEAEAEVPVIPLAERLRTEERKGRGQKEGRKGKRGEEPEADPEANPADGHMDFLA